MDLHSESIKKQISDRAQEFCLDNPRLLGLHSVIETAMLIGALVALGTPDDNQSESPESEEIMRQLFEG